MSPEAQAAVLLAAVLLPVGALLAWLLATRVFVWRPLRSAEVAGAGYAAPAGVDPARVAAALDEAARALAAHVEGWDATTVSRALRGCRVLVVAAEEWTNRDGRRVGGEQDGNVLKVGRSLSALCHEAAHLCEAAEPSGADASHGTWARRGVWAADEAYRAWLARP